MFLACKSSIARAVEHIGISGAVLHQHVADRSEGKRECLEAVGPRMLAILRKLEADRGAYDTTDQWNKALLRAWSVLVEEKMSPATKHTRKWLLEIFLKWGIAHDTLIDLYLALEHTHNVARKEVLEVGANLFTLARPAMSYGKLRHDMLEIYLAPRPPPATRLPMWISNVPEEDGYLSQVEEQLSALMDEARDYFSDFFPEYDEREQLIILEKDDYLKQLWESMLSLYVNIYCTMREAADVVEKLNHGLTARFIAYLKMELNA